ncbi:MAG: DNA phosphorothioation-associated putative methyltransferase, partial [Deltaproteobacteria bacterium]
MKNINRHRTAIKRYKLSRPLALLLDHQLLESSNTFLDYGCGHGHDIDLLKKNRFKNLNKYDPHFCPENPLIESEVVNLGYVLNVIEDPKERISTLKKAFSLATKVLCVSVMIRTHNESLSINRYNDGELSSWGTFQKYFEQSEFKNYLEQHLKTDAIPLEPGIFVVFKNEMDKLEYLSNRYRRRVYLEITQLDKPSGEFKKVKVFKKCIEELIPESPFFKPSLRYTEAIGRLPEKDEFEPYKQLIEEYRSMRKIEDCILANIDENKFLDNRAQRIEEILVFLALRRFDKRGFPKKKDLPKDFQYDIKSFFQSYTSILPKAEALLFSIGNERIMKECFKAAEVGKALPQALYIHNDYIHTLPAPLQVKIGVARSLLGTIEDCNLIKINKEKDKISFLCYEDFSKVP